MVVVQPFAVEQWMDEYETTAKYNIAETCSSSISLDDLCAFAGDTRPADLFDSSRKLGYGAIRGSEELRSAIARLHAGSYEGAAAQVPTLDNVLITPGAINANFLLLYTLVHVGDHVVCHYPTYQQLYSVPESLGAEVTLWKTSAEKDWELNVDELTGLIKENTKLIILNNPQNPTGKTIPTKDLQQIINIARERNIYVFCDEVYRPLFHSLDTTQRPASAYSLGYDKVIITGSVSKAYALAGIRIGWIIANKEMINQCLHARDYTTISVSQLDDKVASFALGEKRVSNLLARNMSLAKHNLDILAAFVEEFSSVCDWYKPLAGTTAFVRFSKNGVPVDDVGLCKMVFERVGVMFVPGGHCFGPEFKGFVRIGYVCETKDLEEVWHSLGFS
ncbi:tyrosine aminotransferase [Nannizzia gypsea CBS 118893]|uniref:Tyrosine aminotransferase n=1 Tax=Arthroderma gypseum (strain ATCC MYA-4604 / CBS 118893) TaxID=535722 RepID=E4USB2_ARTGP|nr:tyrosine aminotransferase [Nannizzia gypsea CBS 118893]EFR01316.1 tyrosine aminotransferase [Nannizzia gypsea CBS 118893]